jgi:hypothetical protein
VSYFLDEAQGVIDLIGQILVIIGLVLILPASKKDLPFGNGEVLAL